ncbi:hypothetical protein [Dendronalium sp. ChiSLP03b]|nr:hypothetical protein [Dendronalium sp. ChiSLP03b]
MSTITHAECGLNLKSNRELSDRLEILSFKSLYCKSTKTLWF